MIKRKRISVLFFVVAFFLIVSISYAGVMSENVQKMDQGQFLVNKKDNMKLIITHCDNQILVILNNKAIYNSGPLLSVSSLSEKRIVDISKHWIKGLNYLIIVGVNIGGDPAHNPWRFDYRLDYNDAIVPGMQTSAHGSFVHGIAWFESIKIFVQ